MCLKGYNNDNDYFDCGDFHYLLDRISEKFTHDMINEYDSDIYIMGAFLYLYNRIPFLTGLEYVGIGRDASNSYVSIEEIEEYIKNRNIKLIPNENFRLSQKRTWLI